MQPWKFFVGIGLILVALVWVHFGAPLPSLSPTAEQEMTEEQFAQSLAESHIQGNVPADKDFLPFLQRDLNVHFGGQAGTPAVQRVEMLREGPTQSGLSYPKFYLWIVLLDGREAVVAVAAIDRKRFQVDQVFFAAEIATNQEVMNGKLPPPVAAAALKRLKLR